METITMCNGAAPGAAPIIFFCLRDGGQTFYHSTGIKARPRDAVRDKRLRSVLEHHKLAMCKAYTFMQIKRMDMNSRIFETQIRRMMTENIGLTMRKVGEPVYQRLVRYIEEAHRDGVIGQSRYLMTLGKALKLQRFLVIKGLSSISAREFTTELLMEYRKFIYDEYLYVAQFPQLYPSGGGKHAPRKRCKDTTVVHDLKALQAFFRELEDTDEIPRSPFKRISGEKRRSIMHVMYDAPVFLKADELRQVMDTEVPPDLQQTKDMFVQVPPDLQQTKDMFVLNCALGCRISDLKRLTMDKVAVSEEGFKYLLLRRATWRHGAFNCQFDGVVYAVFVSLGFALWENIGYVAIYGFSTALVRAVTAVPGHACFGVFMGAWYGQAKRYDLRGDEAASRRSRHKALWLPMLLHGTYDFVASSGSELSALVFLAFIVIMYVVAIRKVRRLSREDDYITPPENDWLV